MEKFPSSFTRTRIVLKMNYLSTQENPNLPILGSRKPSQKKLFLKAPSNYKAFIDSILATGKIIKNATFVLGECSLENT